MGLEEYKGVFVYAQQVDNEISSISYELIGKGKELAADLGTEVTAVLLGSNVKGLADQLGEHGADKVIVVDNKALETYRTEPYAFCQMVAGKDAPSFGEGKNSWLTGTAAWTFATISQFILGIKPDFDGLRIDPCIPSDCDGYNCVRVFRGKTYNIHVTNPNHVEKGVASLKVNGTVMPSNVIDPTLGEDTVEVEVVLG